MSIDRTQRLQAITAVQPRDTTAEKPQKARKNPQPEHSQNGTQVRLSEAQAQLMQPGSQDIDMNRVEAIKQAIRNGDLTMDTGKIADALLQEMQNDSPLTSGPR